MFPQPPEPSRPGRLIRKLFVSAFVLGSFALYALHQRQDGTSGDMAAGLQAATAAATLQVASAPTQPPTLRPTRTPLAATSIPLPPAPTQPAPTPAPAAGQYRDGTYTGDLADAWYGPLQVAARIQGGRIQDVQFLDYPQDRRTSARINRIATPLLVQEAIQAQSAQVDIVSGATLTSEAFIESLQAALDQARS
jgi:uncharacterized protein with FMN-binding domain